MSMDYVALSGLIIAVLGAIGTFINTLHIRECDFLCIHSKCMEEARQKYKLSKSGSAIITPPETPCETTPLEK